MESQQIISATLADWCLTKTINQGSKVKANSQQTTEDVNKKDHWKVLMVRFWIIGMRCTSRYVHIYIGLHNSRLNGTPLSDYVSRKGVFRWSWRDTMCVIFSYHVQISSYGRWMWIVKWTICYKRNDVNYLLHIYVLPFYIIIKLLHEWK